MTNRERIAAMAWEARRRGIQYGQLVANLKLGEDIEIYKKWQNARANGKVEAARG